MMLEIELSEQTMERLESLRVEDETNEEIINELIGIYETTELTLFRTGDDI